MSIQANCTTNKQLLGIPSLEALTQFRVVDASQEDAANRDRRVTLVELRKLLNLTAFAQTLTPISHTDTVELLLAYESILLGGVTVTKAGVFTLPRVGVYEFTIREQWATPAGMSSGLTVTTYLRRNTSNVLHDRHDYISPAATVTDALKPPGHAIVLRVATTGINQEYYLSLQQTSGAAYDLTTAQVSVRLVAVGTPA